MDSAFRVLFSLHRGSPHYGAWVIACLQGAWTGLVGDRLAEACQPVFFKDAELTVKVQDEKWEDAVRNLKPELLQKLRAATSCELSSIKVVSRMH